MKKKNNFKNKTYNILKPYQKYFGYAQRHEYDKLALKYMKNCKKIIDIGCGDGRFVSKSPNRIIGLDGNKDTVKYCQKKGLNVILGIATQLPFDNSSIDGIHSSHMIEHLKPEEAYQFLKEINRVLKIGGILCITAPLLHEGFYNDLSHIKPYNPNAILHYLKEKKILTRTKNDIDGQYKVLKLKYRRGQIFGSLKQTPLWPIEIFGNFLYKFNITKFKKTGYMLIIKKIK